MKSIILLLAASLIVAHSKAQPIAGMFRDNAHHLGNAAMAGNLVYDTRAWSFFSGAPVRSTPLVINGVVYFGNTAGDFFAVDSKSGRVKWKYHSSYAINSSAAMHNGIVFFSDNEQTVYGLQASTGAVRWKFKMGNKQGYPWRFDYFYSSPALFEDKLVIGGDDGNVYLLNQKDGKMVWKFKSKGIIRSTAAINNNVVFTGDMDGVFYALDAKTGKEKWNFKTMGDTLKNEDFGFDRKAILSSPVISGDKIIFGCRDGILYCVNMEGNLVWKMDHHVSWVISTVAIKDSFVVTGTSDGHFVQAVNLNNGKEIWKYRPNTLFWSSPTIVNDMVYAGGFDGQIHVIDLKTGKRVSQFSTGGIVLSSAVFNNDLVYVGSDDGNLYALTGHPDNRFEKNDLRRYAFYDGEAKVYFRSGSDQRIKDFLGNNGFKVIGSDTLPAILSQEGANRSVIVFASDIVPENVIANGKESQLRKYLDNGGRIVLLGINPLTYQIDAKTKQAFGFGVPKADSVLDIQYGPNDTRSFEGQFANFATERGKQLGLADFWVSLLFIDPAKVDIVLGKNENGRASAFVKKYPNGGRLVQIYINQDLPTNFDAVLKVSEWKLD